MYPILGGCSDVPSSHPASSTASSAQCVDPTSSHAPESSQKEKVSDE
jgi:hypothetical protein